MQVVATATAVLARILESEVAELPQPHEDLVREPAGFLPGSGMGAQRAGDEAANRRAERLVLLRERGKGTGRPSGRRAAHERMVEPGHVTAGLELR
jgi:hypothetical protein